MKTEENTMKTKMNSKTADRAETYRLPTASTPENLEPRKPYTAKACLGIGSFW